ncbi:hypothetical protein DSM104299_00541 [Baekduia alba]|uniref:hypothetical protein n=1 Tax=Baekduia alba TaxID=2997333 RepID=UPI00234199FD|nr:hypothetical protein [Baekduia alba]WCB91863.1 hypothetical protein DSM104299_00541 [Baekduia alba]
MTPHRLHRTIVCALSTAALTFALAGPASAKGTQVLSGTLAAGGTWTLSIYHQNIGPVKGICIDVDAVLADGFAPGTATGCAAGSLSVDHGIFPLGSSSASGDTKTSAIEAGVVDRRAHDVRITFADGKHLKVLTKPGPKAWRHVLKTDVRYFGADLLGTTAAAVTRVSAYDKRGHRIGRTGALKP